MSKTMCGRIEKYNRLFIVNVIPIIGSITWHKPLFTFSLFYENWHSNKQPCSFDRFTQKTVNENGERSLNEMNDFMTSACLHERDFPMCGAIWV